MHCPLHSGYPFAFFCKQGCCGTTICAMCVAEDRHKGHSVVKLSEAIGTSRQEIEVAQAAAMLALTEVNDGIVDVNKRRKEVEKSTDATHAIVQQSYRKIAAGIIVQEKKAKADVLAEGQRKEGVLVKQRDGLETAKDRLESGLGLSKKVLDHASEVKLLQITRTVVDGLGAATHHGVPIEPQCGALVLFVESAEMVKLKEELPLLGNVSGSDTNPALCTADGDGTKEAGVGQEAVFVVTAVDFQGNKMTAGGDGITLKVTFVGGGGGGGGDGGEGGGGGGAAGAGAGAGGQAAQIETSDGPSILAAVTAQGLKIRELKTGGADKAKLMSEVCKSWLLFPHAK